MGIKELKAELADVTAKHRQLAQSFGEKGAELAKAKHKAKLLENRLKGRPTKDAHDALKASLKTSRILLADMTAARGKLAQMLGEKNAEVTLLKKSALDLCEWDLAVIRLSLRRYANAQDMTCERGYLKARGARMVANDLDKFVTAKITWLGDDEIGEGNDHD